MSKNASSTCALSTCTNIVSHQPISRRKREYCSNACRQKAYRLRTQPALKRNRTAVTISTYEQMLKLLQELPIDQLQAIHEQTDMLLQQRSTEKTDEPFLYFRKGSGVVHLTVSRNVTICGKETNKMTNIEPTGTDRICKQCSKVRQNGTWWKTWRKEFGDGIEHKS